VTGGALVGDHGLGVVPGAGLPAAKRAVAVVAALRWGHRHVRDRLAGGLAAVVAGGAACWHHHAVVEFGGRAPGAGGVAGVAGGLRGEVTGRFAGRDAAVVAARA